MSWVNTLPLRLIKWWITPNRISYIPEELFDVLTKKSIDLEDELLEIVWNNIWVFANDEEREIENEFKRKRATYNRIFKNFEEQWTFESIFEIEAKYIFYHILKYFIQKWEVEIVQATISILQEKWIDINCPTLAYNQIEISSLDVALLKYQPSDFWARSKIVELLLESWATSLIAQNFGNYENFIINQKNYYKSLWTKPDFYPNYNKLYDFFKLLDEDTKKNLLFLIWPIKNISQIIS